MRVAEELLSRARTAEDVVLATRVRGEVKRQDREDRAAVAELREREESWARRRRRDLTNAGLQFGALFGGGALVIFHHEWIGGFAIAAALYGVARDFVMQKFPGGNAAAIDKSSNGEEPDE